MPFLGWIAVVSALLLVLAFASARIDKLPISTAVVYLGVGLALGPLGLGVVQVDVVTKDVWLLRVTEIALFVSLFIGGLRLGRPRVHAARSAPLRLVGPAMLLTIAGVACLAHLVLGLDAAAALLAGAVLAPTDPVLSSEVAVNDAADRDCVRYGLSGEAGLNDGAAMPFVLLALGLVEHGGAGAWLWGWVGGKLVYAVLAGAIVGYLLGYGVGWLAMRGRSRARVSDAPTDFLVLALIGLAYAAVEAISGLGFLAVFAAGVGLRGAERRLSAQGAAPAEHGVGAHPSAEELGDPRVAAGVVVAEALSFGDTAERLLEFLIVVLVGVSLATHWDARGLVLAAGLFLVVRPLATQVALIGSGLRAAQRWLMGWFGLRGIGSLYYLAFAMHQGLDGAAVREIADVTVTTVGASILLHGVTATPLLSWYERRLARARGGA